MINIALAMEAPISLLKDLPYITDFDWVLTHLCEASEGYLEHYQDMVNRWGRQVILDNSVNELGEPIDLSRMDEVVAKLNPTYIVPPDYLNDLHATLDQLDEAIELWGRERIIPVLQGTSIEEVITCADILKTQYDFKIVSVPYDIMLAHRSKLPDGDPNKASLEELGDTRSEVLSTLIEEGLLFSRYHLLGLNNLEEIRSYKEQFFWNKKRGMTSFDPQVSLDTGAPMTNAVWGQKFGLDTLVPKGVYFNYYDYNEFLEPDIKETWYWNTCMLRGSLSGR